MTRRFEFPETARFTCRSCGDCCRSFDVPLAPGEAERLRALDWTGREERLAGVDPAVRLPRGSGAVSHRLPRDESGACLFLEPETNRCLIHAAFGAEAKPLACRLYPFSFLRLGEAVAVDVAFSCSAVSAGDGDLLAGQVADWDQLLDETGGEPLALRPRLGPGRPLAPDVLREVSSHLDALLAQPELDTLDRLRCAVRYVRLALTGDPESAAAAALRDALRTGLPRQVGTHDPEGPLDPTQRSVFFQWLHVTVNPPRPNTDLAEGKVLDAERKRRVADADRYLTAGQRPFVAGRELAVTHEDIPAVEAAALRTDRGGSLREFLAAKLVGQRFLRTAEADVPFLVAAHQLLLSVPLVVWTAKALAADAGRSAVAPPDVRSAIRLVDRGLGQVSVTALPKKQARAFEWVLTETDLVTGAARELLAD